MMLGAGTAAAALVGLAPQRAAAVLKLDVTQGNIQPVPIAIPDFIGVGLRDPSGGRNVSQVVASNLQRSGLFARNARRSQGRHPIYRDVKTSRR